MSSFRQKFLNLKYEYKKVVKAFQFVKWSLKHATLNETPFEFPLPKCGSLGLVLTNGLNYITPSGTQVDGNTVVLTILPDDTCPNVVAYNVYVNSVYQGTEVISINDNININIV
jgi:hypothetical protein